MHTWRVILPSRLPDEAVTAFKYLNLSIVAFWGVNVSKLGSIRSKMLHSHTSQAMKSSCFAVFLTLVLLIGCVQQGFELIILVDVEYYLQSKIKPCVSLFLACLPLLQLISIARQLRNRKKEKEISGMRWHASQAIQQAQMPKAE